jgi:predicted nuclease of predicted toxin-antitoxin system
MRFLVDECTGPAVARWLEEQGHEVYSVYEKIRGADDEEIIKRAFAEQWIVITNDKDFGEKVYREKYPHRGIILLRLQNDRVAPKIAAIKRVLDHYADRLVDRFVVVTEKTVRFSRRHDSG